MNRYRKGANLEREAVNRHIKNGAILAGRFAGSKCKGKIKVDVVAIYPAVKLGKLGRIVLEQYKKGKGSFTRERIKFLSVSIPKVHFLERKFIVQGDSNEKRTRKKTRTRPYFFNENSI